MDFSRDKEIRITGQTDVYNPTGTKAELEACRYHVVDLLKLGHGVRKVIEGVGVYPGSVTRWLRMKKRETSRT